MQCLYFMVFFLYPRHFCFPFVKSLKRSKKFIADVICLLSKVFAIEKEQKTIKKGALKILTAENYHTKKKQIRSSCNRRILLLQVFGLGYRNPVRSIIWTQVSCYKKYNIHQPPDTQTSESQQFSYTSATLTQTKSIHAKESK